MGEKKKQSRNFGHLKGVEIVKKIVASSIKLKIPILTFTYFRQKIETTKKEISFLFKLIQNYFLNEINRIVDQGIKINILGGNQ